MKTTLYSEINHMKNMYRKIRDKEIQTGQLIDTVDRSIMIDLDEQDYEQLVKESRETGKMLSSLAKSYLKKGMKDGNL